MYYANSTETNLTCCTQKCRVSIVFVNNVTDNYSNCCRSSSLQVS